MNIVDLLTQRGLVDAVTSSDLAFVSSSPIKVYAGFDPTADSLHLGNLVGMVVLRWMQKYGHTPIVLLGGATGMIGDPSGKSMERPLLDAATVESNIRQIRTQFEQILDFFDLQAKPVIVNNGSWFSSMSVVDFLRDVGKHFRIGAMLGKEMVRSRMESEEGLSFTEFSYQLLQGYDFCYLFQKYGVVLQMGGSDQWGNITAGIDLTRKLTGKSVYGLTWPLLTRSDGKKFGKSEGGAIWLSPDKCSPYEMYQYLYRVPDLDVIKLLKMVTFVDLEEIARIEASMKRSDYIPNTAQKRLAEEITKIVHGEEGVVAALRATEAAAPGKSGDIDPEVLEKNLSDMPHTTLPLAEVVGHRFVDVAAKTGFFPSKSEAVRMIGQGGAYLNHQKVEDPQLKVIQDDLVGGRFLVLGAGKKKKLIIQVF